MECLLLLCFATFPKHSLPSVFLFQAAGTHPTHQNRNFLIQKMNSSLVHLIATLSCFIYSTVEAFIRLVTTLQSAISSREKM